MSTINAEFAFFRLEGNLPVLYTSFSDAFDSTTLNPAWTWLDENPAGWNLSERPGYLRIRMHAGNIGDENLLYRTPPQGMYDVRTRLLFTPTDNFQIAGIPVYLDYDNHLMLGRGKCDEDWIGTCVGNGIYFDNLARRIFLGSIATAVHETDIAHLRIFRTGAHYFGFYSADGAHWRLIGMHNFSAASADLKLGLAVGQDTAGTSNPADFDTFLLKADTVGAAPACDRALAEPVTQHSPAGQKKAWLRIQIAAMPFLS